MVSSSIHQECSSSYGGRSKIVIPRMLSKLDKGSWSQSARNIRAALEIIRSQPGFREEDMIMDISSKNAEQVHEEETQPATEQNVSLPKMDDDDYDSDSDSDNEMSESKQQVLARKKMNEPKEDDDEKKRKIAELQAQILAVEKKLVVARLQEEARQQREQQKAAGAQETNTSKLTVEDATEWTADSDDDSEYTEVEVEDDDDEGDYYEEPVVMEETASTTPTTEVEEEEVKDDRVYTCEETEERVLVNWASQETFFRRRQAALRPAQVSLPGATMSLKERMRQFQVKN